MSEQRSCVGTWEMVMERSVMLPDRRRLLRGAVLNIAGCTVALIMAQRLSVPDGNLLGAALFACGAGAFAANVARTLWMLIMRTPAFVADEEGFAVMGGRHRPWSQYRATRIERLPGLVPLSSVVIEFRTGPLTRVERLPAYALPEASRKFARRVEALSAKKKWIADLASEPAVPSPQPIRPDAGDMPVAVHLPQAGRMAVGGPAALDRHG